MTAHVRYPRAAARHGVTDWPASLSPHWIGQVLRRDLGFNGLVLSDAIEMRALSDHWTPEHCGFRALNAGTDILVYYREEHQFEAFYRLRRALERGEIDPALVRRSLERVERVKRRWLADAAAPARRQAAW